MLVLRRDFNSLFDSLFLPDESLGFKEKDDKFLLKLKVPGFSEDEIKVSINDGIIKVEGKCERKDDTFTSVNSFTESYTLPRNADLESINAELKNGILAISLGKKELKSKEVQVKLLK